MSPQLIDLLITSLLDTLLMVGVASAIAVLVGIPLGVILTVTARGNMLENQPVNHALGAVINATRSVPFVILMVAIIPFTRLVAQTSIGTTAAIVPLSVAAIPFMARIAENAMREVDPGLITAARAMGASPMQIIMKVLLPEALPGIIGSLTTTAIAVIGYTAMAGAVGGKGMGDLAIRMGYQSYDNVVMIATVVILVLIVIALQSAGTALARAVDHRAVSR